ncbi:MAG: methyltransferase [Bacteroidales bacterium]|jgi:tRNA1Val (adenine37-N6)-methyltransferase|nr:methyltransferase [Bacteroidales bacterium]
MDESIFKFKKFEILQNSSVMKVGTDGVLLGAVADCKDAKRILDIGTGTGLIALMMAQSSEAMIDCIDINKHAVELAERNILKSQWNDRINIYFSSLQDFNPSVKYDLIISNPPYFTNGIIAADKNRALARHTVELSYFHLADNVARLLDNNGKFYVIYPAAQSKQFEIIAKEYNMFVDLKINIYPRHNLPVVRVISGYSKLKNPVIKEDTIILENDTRHDFTEQYKNLTREYYINF